MPYPSPLETFETGIVPEPVFTVPLIEEGIEALRALNRDMGLGMDPWDIGFYHDLFVSRFRRNPTNVECFQLAQANSEHSRHWFFKGKLVIDGRPASETLLQIIQSTLRANPAKSVIAFRDNSSAIRGYEVATIIPSAPGRSSAFREWRGGYAIIFTAETLSIQRSGRTSRIASRSRISADLRPALRTLSTQNPGDRHG